MELKRKNLHRYDSLIDLDEMSLDFSLESIYKALQDTDENNYGYIQTLIRQNALLQKQLASLEEKMTMLDMKINYLLDNPKY